MIVDYFLFPVTSIYTAARSLLGKSFFRTVKILPSLSQYTVFVSFKRHSVPCNDAILSFHEALVSTRRCQKNWKAK